MNTLKVLIVDDEILVANLLSNSINWKELNIETPKIATNADAALSLMDEESFDIVFTDIHMPVTNGLSLAKEIKMRYPYVQIIVVTGYTDFEYAKESISIGILKYIQKPIQPNEIQEAVLYAQQKIANNYKNVQEYALLRDQLFSNMEYLREQLLNKLVLGELDSTELSDILKQYDIAPMEKIISIAVVELLFPPHSTVSLHMMLCQSALKLLKNLFEYDNQRYAFLDTEQRIVLLSFSANFNFYSYATNIKNYLTQQLGCNVHIGIGSTYNWDSHLSRSYQEAISALQLLQDDHENAISDFSNLYFNHIVTPDDCTKEIRQLLFLIQSGLNKKALSSLNIIKQLLKQHNLDIYAQKNIAMVILAGITQIILLLGLEGIDAFYEQYKILGKLYSCSSSESLFDELSTFILSTITKITKLYHQEENEAITLTKQYIQNNLSNNALSLNTAALHLGYNKSYLSRLFKRETNTTFSDYLMSVRMEEAIRLIHHTSLRAYQIAEKIGFSDANYFSTCFKKYTGMSVVKYRSQQTN